MPVTRNGAPAVVGRGKECRRRLDSSNTNVVYPRSLAGKVKRRNAFSSWLPEGRPGVENVYAREVSYRQLEVFNWLVWNIGILGCVGPRWSYGPT